MELKILSFNVRNWTRDTKKSEETYWKKRSEKISELITKLNPDIIFFQEMMFPMTRHAIPKEYKKRGLSISHHVYFKKELNVKLNGWHIHWCKRRLELSSSHIPKSINIFSIHSHWDEKKYLKFARDINKAAEDRLVNIVAGDWNVEASIMQPLMPDFIFKVPDKITFENWKKHNQGIIDYVACTYLDDSVKIQRVDVDGLSDHWPILITINL